MKKTALILIVATLLVACGNKAKSEADNQNFTPIEVKYAKGFSIDQFNDFQRVTIYSVFAPEGEYQQRLYLVKDSEVETPKDGLKIVVPIKSLATASVTYNGFLELLDVFGTVKGVTQPEISYSEKVREGRSKGEIIDIGDAFAPSVEQLLVLRPEVFMLPSFNKQEALITRLEQAGIRFVFNNEWQESTPLGRTEWVKLIAALYDQLPKADSIFSEIESRYNDAKNLTKNLDGKKPTILLNANFRGTWYMPAGNSYIANLVQDAGGDYLYQDRVIKDGTSLSMDFETVLKNFSTADVWLNVPTLTLSELEAMESRHKLFRPMQTGEVYHFMKRYLPSSANDYWEGAIAQPDVLLLDIIKALHPTLLPDYESVYVEKCKP